MTEIIAIVIFISPIVIQLGGLTINAIVYKEEK